MTCAGIDLGHQIGGGISAIELLVVFCHAPPSGIVSDA